MATTSHAQLNLQIDNANLPNRATFKLTDRIPWDVTISPIQGGYAGGGTFLAYVTGRDIYGNVIYIEVGRGVIPAIAADDTFSIRNQLWQIPNDGTLFNIEAPGYSFIVALFDVAAPPITLQRITDAAADPLRSRSGSFFIDVIPDLAVAGPGLSYRPGDYRGGDVVNFTASWGNRAVGERPLSSRPLRPNRDRYSVSLHITENAAFNTGPAPTPSPSPSPTPSDPDPDEAPVPTDSVNDDFKLMGIIFAGDLGAILPDGSNQFRRVQVVGTPAGTRAWPAAGSMNPYGLLLPGGAGTIPLTPRDYTPQPDDGFLDIGEGVILTSEQLVPRNFEGDYFVAMRLQTASDARTGNNVFVSNAANKISIDPTADPDLEPASAVSDQIGTFVQGANAGSSDGGISDTGTIVFSSRASNLLVPPTQASETVPPQFATSGNQIFLKLRDTREMILASRTSAGLQANADCFDPYISADGRYVAFHSTASNLVEENTGGRSMIYLHDIVTRETVVVSRNAVGALANGDSYNASLSASGRFVVFESVASNLDAPIVQPVISTSGSTIGQIRSYSVLSGGSGYQPGAQFEVTLVGGAGSGARGRATVGADGNIIAVNPIGTNYGGGYLAANPPTVVVPPSPQVYPPLAGQGQVYLHDRNVDGRVDADGNAVFDEPGNTRTYLVSAGKNAFGEFLTISDNLSFQPVVNADDASADLQANGGMFVAFSSYASNLPGASSGRAMVYRALVDVENEAGVVDVLPASVNNAGTAGVAPTAPGVIPFNLQPAISGDGSQVAFTSWSSNLVYNPNSGLFDADTNGVQDVFVRNFRITIDPLSPDSRATVRVSVSEEKVATGIIFFGAPVPSPFNLPNNLPAPNDSITISTGTVTNTFVFDPTAPLLPGQIAVPIGNSVLQSRDNLLNQIAGSPLRLGNTRIEAVETTPPNAAPGTGYEAGIYLKNTSRGTGGNVAILVGNVATPVQPQPVSLLVGAGANGTIYGSGMSGGGTQAEDNPRAVQGVPFGSNEPSIDRSGRYVTFRTIAGNLDVYLNDASRSYYQPENPITGELIRPLLTAGSAASNVYVHDRNAQDLRDAGDAPVFDQPFDPATKKEFTTTRRVSVNRFGYPTYVTGTQEGGVNANSSANSSDPFISPNGNYVVFTSTAPGEGGLIFGPNNLSPLDSASLPDVFIADLGILGDAPPSIDTRPTVTILSPQDGLRIAPNTDLSVSVAARAKTGKTVSSVQFFVNNNLVNTLTSEPFGLIYRVPTTGEYIIRARVTDSSGLTRDASVKVFCDQPVAGAPFVQMTQPIAGVNFVTGSKLFLNARASATSPAEISRDSVRFTINGQESTDGVGYYKDSLGQETFGVLYTPTEPFTVDTYRAQATDTAKVTSLSSPLFSSLSLTLSPLPVVVMRQPSTASPVNSGDTVTLEAEVFFPDTGNSSGRIPNRVEFYVNKVYIGEGIAGSAITGGRTLYTIQWEVPPVESDLSGPAFFQVYARAVALNFQSNTDNNNVIEYYGSTVDGPRTVPVYYVPTDPPLGSNEAFIIDNFEKIFFRAPNFQEYQEYLDLFAAGLSQSQIIEAMLKSTEFAEFQQVLFGFYLRMGLSPGNWTPTNRASLDTLLNYLDVMRSANGRTLLPAAMSADLAADVTNLPQPYGATLGQAQVASALLNTPTLTTGGVRVSNLQNQAFRDWMLRTFNVPYLPTALPVGQTVAWQGDQATMLTTIAGPYPTAGATAIQRYGANYAFISAMYAAINEGRMNPAMKPWLTAFPGLVRGIAFQYLYKGTWNTSAPAATAAEIAKNLVPGITSPAVVNSGVGTVVSYQITTQNAAVIPPYAATSLPPGLTLNTTTGLITGTPTAAGEFKALLSATNVNGTGTKQVTFTIIAPAPAISNQAINANVGDGVEYQIASTPDPTVYPTTYTLAGGINQIRVTDLGAGYSSAPTVAISGGGGSGAAATAVLGTGANLGKVVAVNITNPGSGYTSNPQIALSGGGGSGAKAAAYVLPQGLSFNKSGGLISGSLASGSEGNYSLKMTVQNSGGSATANLTINVVAISPTNNTVLSGFTTVRGTPSTNQSFNLSGSNLTTNITLTPPAGWQIATNTNNFTAPSLTIATNPAGVVSNTMIYVRLAGTNTTATNYTNSVLSLASGTFTNNVLLSGAVTDPATAISKWLASYGISARNLNLGTCTDGDGACYYDEFAFGTDPTKFDRNPWTVTTSPGKVTISWLGRKRTEGSVDYSIERSESMASTSWSSMSINPPTSGVAVTYSPAPASLLDSGSYERISVEIPIPANQSSGFYKVKGNIRPSALP